jgi:hypothetical protein
MPNNFSDYTETNIIQSTLRGVAFPVASAIYIALFTADPTDANITANEFKVANLPAYVRQNAAGAGTIDTGWAAPANGVSSNAKVVTFPANNGAAAITATHVGIYDAATGGNLLYAAPLTSAKTLQIGDVLSFGIGTLTVTVD